MPPFVENPLGGLLGVRTASFYKLDPTGTVPVASIADFVPAFGSERVVLDMIDSEDVDISFDVTTNALQDFRDATSNVHKNLDQMVIQGTLVSSIDFALIGSVGTGGIPGFGGGLRADLIRLANLEEMANRREPIMVVTPRRSFAKAFIRILTPSWTPDLGDNTIITVGLVEARIVNPLSATDALLDVAGSFTGNNIASSQGAQATTPVTTQAVIPPTTFGLPPTIIPFV